MSALPSQTKRLCPRFIDRDDTCGGTPRSARIKQTLCGRAEVKVGILSDGAMHAGQRPRVQWHFMTRPECEQRGRRRTKRCDGARAVRKA